MLRRYKTWEYKQVEHKDSLQVNSIIIFHEQGAIMWIDNYKCNNM